MAAPPFGFSVGDFIAGVSLVKDLIQALDDTSGARPAYRRLISELRTLDKALTTVQKLDVVPAQTPQKIALEQVAAQCHKSIERFLTKNAKFQATLGLQSPANISRWRSSLHKVQWALCKDSAIDGLRTEISGHTTTINLILNTIQITALKLQADLAESGCQTLRSDEKETQALVKKNHDLLTTQADLIVSISQMVTAITTHEQGCDLQSFMKNVLDSNMKIYTRTLEMQNLMQSQLPPQIERQQPVYFEDAHGRISPFHIEFINSFEAFQSVLEVRFQYVPGFRKVKQIEYIVQDSRLKKPLDLRNNAWERMFLPGRKFNMSMVFRNMPTDVSTSCPSCYTENAVAGENKGTETKCSNPDCGMWYQRVEEIETMNSDNAQNSKLGKRARRSSDNWPTNGGVREDSAGRNVNAARGAEEGEEVHQFRRVQVVHPPAAEVQRVIFVHELAVHDRSLEYLAKKCTGEEGELKRTLEKIADYIPDSREWAMKMPFWKELDVWNYDYDTQELRQQVINNAVRHYDRQRLPSWQPEWQNLLPKDEREQGKCLSKLQALLAKGPSWPPPKIKVQKVDGSPSSLDETGSLYGDQPKAGAENMLRSAYNLPPGKEARVKRLLSNSKPRAAVTEASPNKARQTRSKANGGRILSKDIIFYSDSSADEAPAVVVEPKPVTIAEMKDTVITKPRTVSQGPIKQAQATIPPLEDDGLGSSSGTPLSRIIKPKRPLEDDDSSSSSGTPLSKRIKPRKPLPVQKVRRHPSDASQNSRGTSTAS